MLPDQFLIQTAAIDLEINESGELFAIGAILGERIYVKDGRFDRHAAVRELDAFIQPATTILGHNLLRHYLPVLHALHPNLRLLQKPAVDTLYLSPLAFPENPYHRLVKDYKLVRDAKNDPVADARLALVLFRDQWESFSRLAENEPDLLSIYRYCLAARPAYKGLDAALATMGTQSTTAEKIIDLILGQVSERACVTHFHDLLTGYLSDPQQRMALAYAIAWLRVAGGNSVLPPWVHRQFIAVAPILRQLREVPCDNTDCAYCTATHDPVAQLQRYFGFTAFRAQPATATGESLQQAIVRQAMSDQPLFAILPTGSGKSLCYQIPALVRYQHRGLLTIVIRCQQPRFAFSTYSSSSVMTVVTLCTST